MTTREIRNLWMLVGVAAIVISLVVLAFASFADARPFPFTDLMDMTLHGGREVERGACGTKEKPILGVRYDTGDGTGWALFYFEGPGYWIATYFVNNVAITTSHGTILRGAKDPITFTVVVDEYPGIPGGDDVSMTPCSFVEEKVGQ